MVKQVFNFWGGVGGVRVDGMAMVEVFSLPGVVDVGGCWRMAGRGGEFPTADLVGYGAVATVAAPASLSITLLDS